jgi:hypothetical protein
MTTTTTQEAGTREAQPHPAGFSVVPRGHGAPLKSPTSQLPALGKIWRNQIRPGTWEAVQAITGDGEWLFERHGRTWSAGHYPTRTALKTGLRSLRACRAYVGTGEARADLERATTTTITETGAGAL